jgi:hypothetical protein
VELVEPPPVNATLTTADGTGLSNASVTRTAGNGLTPCPTVPETAVGDCATILAAAPASDVTVIVTDGTPATVIVKVLDAIAPPRVQLPTDVGPRADTVAAFASVPPPAVTVTLTATPAMTFPFWSLTTNVGLVGRATPAVALAGGAETISIEVATGGGPDESPQAPTIRNR